MPIIHDTSTDAQQLSKEQDISSHTAEERAIAKNITTKISKQKQIR